jgi:hypothetical protein
MPSTVPIDFWCKEIIETKAGVSLFDQHENSA